MFLLLGLGVIWIIVLSHLLLLAMGSSECQVIAGQEI